MPPPDPKLDLGRVSREALENWARIGLECGPPEQSGPAMRRIRAEATAEPEPPPVKRIDGFTIGGAHPPAQPPLRTRAPVCDHCENKPAFCVGRYEGNATWQLACDDCCGHGNEDGRCYPLAAEPPTPRAELTRWSPCEVDAEDEDGPVFQGFLTDPRGAWVKWEDVEPLPPTPRAELTGEERAVLDVLRDVPLTLLQDWERWPSGWLMLLAKSELARRAARKER